MSTPATQPSDETVNSLAQYSRALHSYTLGLWTESRRMADQNAGAQGPVHLSPPARQEDGNDKGGAGMG